MHLSVNFDLCCGHALCAEIAPELFEMRDDDKAYVLLESPPEELRHKAEEAVRACPQMAIDLFES